MILWMYLSSSFYIFSVFIFIRPSLMWSWTIMSSIDISYFAWPSWSIIKNLDLDRSCPLLTCSFKQSYDECHVLTGESPWALELAQGLAVGFSKFPFDHSGRFSSFVSYSAQVVLNFEGAQFDSGSRPAFCLRRSIRLCDNTLEHGAGGRA